MATQTFRLTQSTLLIKTGFTIRQFVITNPTQNPIFVNLSGLIPTPFKYEMFIQANSIITSPAILTTQVYLTTTLVDINRVASITIYDSATLPASNVPYLTRQNVPSLPGYPVNVNISGSQIANLPNIYVSSFKNIYFIISQLNPARTAFRLSGFSIPASGVAKQFGGYGGNTSDAGVFTYNPSQINAVHSFVIQFAESGNWQGVIDAIQTDDIISITQLAQSPEAFSFAGNTNVFKNYYYAKPPGFYYAVELIHGTGLTFNYTDVYVKAYLNGDNQNISHRVIDQHFAGTVPAAGAGVDIPYLVSPTFFPVSIGSFLIFYLQDVSGLLTGGPGITTNVWNFDN